MNVKGNVAVSGNGAVNGNGAVSGNAVICDRELQRGCELLTCPGAKWGSSI